MEKRKVCSECLGDLVFCSSAEGDYYRCIQCNQRTARREGAGHLVELPSRVATQPSDFFPADQADPESIAS